MPFFIRKNPRCCIIKKGRLENDAIGKRDSARRENDAAIWRDLARREKGDLLRILIVANRFFPCIGGAETHMLENARSLAAGGHDVTVLTSAYLGAAGGGRANPADDSAACPGVKIVRMPFFRIFGLDLLAVFPTLPLEMLFFRQYDIAFVQSWGNSISLASIIFAKLSGKAVANAPYYTHETNFPFFVKAPYEATFGKFAFSFSDRIIALTETERKEISGRFGVPLEKISAIPPSIPHGKYLRPDLGKKARAEFNFGKSKVILFAGRLAKNKGLPYLVDAFAALCRKDGKLLLVIAGPDEGQRAEIEKRAARHGLGGKVILAGRLEEDDFIGMLNCADVLVLPSLWNEAFGIVLLEAMAAGTPVVASDVGGIRDFVSPENGALVRPGDSEGLAEAIRKILSLGKMHFAARNIWHARKFGHRAVSKRVEDELMAAYGAHRPAAKKGKMQNG